MANETLQSPPTDNQVVPPSMKLEPVDEYRDYTSESNDFVNISFLRAAGENPLELNSTSLPPLNRRIFTEPPHEDNLQQQRELTPAPLFVPTAIAARAGTPSRIKMQAIVDRLRTMTINGRRCLSEMPSRRVHWDRLTFNKQDKIPSFLRRVWSSRYCKLFMSKVKSFVSFYGPGVTLTIFIHLALSFIGTFSSSPRATTSVATFNSGRWSIDPQSQQLNSGEQVFLDELYCTTIFQKTKFCPDAPGQVINLTNQCDLKDQEYQEKIQVLEGEIGSLRQQFSEKLALKETKLKKLIRGVSNFRAERFFVLKTFVYQCLLAIVIISLSFICYIVL